MPLKHILTFAKLLLYTALVTAQARQIELPQNLYAFTLQEDSNGKVWVGLSDGNTKGALGYIHEGDFVQVSGIDKLPNGSYHTSVKLLDGSLMFGGNVIFSSDC